MLFFLALIYVVSICHIIQLQHTLLFADGISQVKNPVPRNNGCDDCDDRKSTSGRQCNKARVNFKLIPARTPGDPPVAAFARLLMVSMSAF